MHRKDDLGGREKARGRRRGRGRKAKDNHYVYS